MDSLTTKYSCEITETKHQNRIENNDIKVVDNFN